MKIIILLAPPAAGKGTQAKLLCEKYNLEHISTGDLIRESIRNQDEMGSYLESQMNVGKLVSDDIILKLLEYKIEEVKQHGYVLDGFPRTIKQAKTYETLLKKRGDTISCVIDLVISEEEAIQRMKGRISCPKCGRIYHSKNHQPKEAGKCDSCHINLIKRDDDHIETFKIRFGTYIEETNPLIQYYQEQSILYHVDSTLPVLEVFQKIESIVNSL